jgi:hypothetical protein
MPHFLHDIDTTNFVDEKPIYYWTNKTIGKIPNDAGYVGIINSANVEIRDLELTKNIQGILLAFTTDSVVSNVSIVQNEWGMQIFFSNDTVIHHNSFVGNTQQAYPVNLFNANWDYDYPSGGNYWSNYNGPDFYSGPYQNESGSDGIGDTTYVVDGNNIDHYPLMNSLTPPDIAVADVLTSKTIVGQGYSLNATLTIENQGNKIEEFSTTIYADSIPINSISFMLRSGNSLIYTFALNTTGFSKGNYTIWAYVTPLSDEIDLSDNNKTAIYQVKVGVPGDLNNDGKSNLSDLIKVAGKFGKNKGDLGYDPNYDMNDDGKINLSDLIKVAKHFGTMDP